MLHYFDRLRNLDIASYSPTDSSEDLIMFHRAIKAPLFHTRIFDNISEVLLKRALSSE